MNIQFQIEREKVITYVLENEHSAELSAPLQRETVDIQLVAPHTHKTNSSETSLKTSSFI